MQRYEMFPESASRNFGYGIRAVVIPGGVQPGIPEPRIRAPDSEKGSQVPRTPSPVMVLCLNMFEQRQMLY